MLEIHELSVFDLDFKFGRHLGCYLGVGVVLINFQLMSSGVEVAQYFGIVGNGH